MTARYVLTPRAKRDLVQIGDSIADEAGLVIAEYVLEKFREAFRFLAEQPGAGHVREDLAEDPAVKFWAVFSYFVAYAHEERPLGIVAIVHGSRDPDVMRRQLRENRGS